MQVRIICNNSFAALVDTGCAFLRFTVIIRGKTYMRRGEIVEETKKLAQKCRDLRFSALPEEVIEKTKYLLLDYIGAAARGALSESSIPVQSLFEKIGGAGDGAVVIGTGLRLNPPYAALANGAAAHSIEMDDVVNAASLHPGVVVMTTAMAAAHISPCTGKEMIEAVVAGYEVMIRLGIAVDPSAHYAQGFHPTSTCGTFAAAVTAAKILKLDVSQTIRALGIAGSQTAGSMEFLSDGSFTKRFHAGWSAHSGLMAALLAGEGFTGPETILEGKFGFLHAYTTKSHPEKVLEKWGDPYLVLKTSVKPHACCRYMQGPIDGVLRVMNENALEAREVARVTLGVLKTGFPLVVEPREKKHNPESIVDAQFSMPFGAAVAILRGKATLDEFTFENIRSSEVKSLMDRVVCVEDPNLEKEFPQKWPAGVTIETKDGKKFSSYIEFPKGDPENPLTWNEIIEKFHQLTDQVYQSERRNQIIDRVRGLEKIDDVGSVCLTLGSGVL